MNAFATGHIGAPSYVCHSTKDSRLKREVIFEISSGNICSQSSIKTSTSEGSEIH